MAGRLFLTCRCSALCNHGNWKEGKETVQAQSFVLYLLKGMTKLILCCLNAEQKKQTKLSEVSLKTLEAKPARSENIWNQ